MRERVAGIRAGGTGERVWHARGLTPDDVQLFEMVTLHGFKVSELAAGRGCARETLARKLSRIRATIAANRAAAQNSETVQ